MTETMLEFPPDNSSNNDGEEYVDNNIEELLDTDEFFEHVGSIGKHQILVTLIVGCLLIIPAYQALIMVFIADSPPWRCSNKNEQECNTTRLYTATDNEYRLRCDMNRSAWEYTMPKSYSIVNEFRLDCSSESLVELANSGLFIGQIVGGLAVGWFSDRFGRKKVLFPSYFMLVLLSVIASFVPNSWSFILFRVLCGIFQAGVLIPTVVMAVEIVGPKHRALCSYAIWCIWPIALSILSLQSWLITDWRTLSLVLSAPYVVLVFGARFVPESVRWLRTQNRLEEAENILKHIAIKNKRIYPYSSRLKPIPSNESRKGSYKDLFSTRHMFWKTFVLGTMCFFNNFLYYGITIAAGDFGGSLHRDFVLITIIEIPATVISIYIVEKIGRKRTTIIGYIFTGLPMIVFGILQICDVHLMSIRVILGMIGKSFNIITWCGVGLWASESYPTIIRSKGSGLCMLLSQAGSAISPWVVQGLKKYHISLPFFIMGVTLVIPSLLALTLKETKGIHIKDILTTGKRRPKKILGLVTFDVETEQSYSRVS